MIYSVTRCSVGLFAGKNMRGFPIIYFPLDIFFWLFFSSYYTSIPYSALCAFWWIRIAGEGFPQYISHRIFLVWYFSYNILQWCGVSLLAGKNSWRGFPIIRSAGHQPPLTFVTADPSRHWSLLFSCEVSFRPVLEGVYFGQTPDAWHSSYLSPTPSTAWV